MKLNDYQKAAQRTSNMNLTKGEHLINGALGLCGESGEVADLIKKAFMQGHTIDRAHVAKEAGDCLWYLAELASALDMTLEEIALMNIDKLLARYPEGFTAEKSLNRAEGDV